MSERALDMLMQFLKSSSLGEWMTCMEKLGDTIILAGQDLEELLRSYEGPVSFQNKLHKATSAKLKIWVMSIGVERCLRPNADKLCLDINGDSYKGTPFNKCDDINDCGGTICERKIPMGMIMGPGPGLWPPCYRTLRSKWVSILTAGNIEFEYFQTKDSGSGQHLDVYIEDWKTEYCHSSSSMEEKLPYVVIKGGSIRLFSSIDSTEMDAEEMDAEEMDAEETDAEEKMKEEMRAIQHSSPIDAGTLGDDGEITDGVSTIGLIMGSGLDNKCVLVLTYNVGQQVWKRVLQLETPHDL